MRQLPVSFFAGPFDAVPRVGTLPFPLGFDDFREADGTPVPGVKDPNKQGPLWSPAIFGPSPVDQYGYSQRLKARVLKCAVGETRRNLPCVVSICALVLDYDHGDLPADEVVARWEKYEHVLHSTYTPGRWRVILPYAAPITPAQHDTVFAWVAAREGTAIDGGCKDASRMFYLPTCRTDLDVDPVFGYNKGELLDPTAIGLDLPRTNVRPTGSSGSPSSQTGHAHEGATSGPAGRVVQAAPARHDAVHGGGADSAYAGIESVDQREDLALIESRCAFMRHVRQDMASDGSDGKRVTQPEWYAALSIIARCRGGDDLSHVVSAPYPGYDEGETEETYQRAKVSAGPRTCADIRKLTGPAGACARCPLQITSPVLLGRNDSAAAPTQTNTRPTGAGVAAAAANADGFNGAEHAAAPLEEDLSANIRDAEARQQQARLAEDAATLVVEGARRRLTLLRSARTTSEEDIAEAVKALGDAREAHRLAERTRKARERDTAAAKKRTSVEGLPPGADPAVWQRLRMNREGTPLTNVANVLTVLDNDPRWSSRLTYDAFALDVCLDGAPLPEEQGTRLVGKLGTDYHLDTSTNVLLECVRATALDRSFHPIRNWLNGLKWDGTARLQDLTLRGFGALPQGDEDLVRLLGERFLLSMVARVMKPGEKVDTMLVLTGKQGMFKTTSFRTLVGQRWFANTKMDLANKDSFINLQGKWLIEFGEMAAVKAADDNVSKGWLSAEVDRFRAPYAKRAEDHPRQSVACGTTNADEFLMDPTGYRRYWPLSVRRADLGWLEEAREQLFAEAVVLYRAGHKWWFDEDTEEAARLKRFAAPYQTSHPWTEEIVRWLESTVGDRNLEVFSVVTVLTRCLQKPVQDIKRNDQTDVGNILKNIGCERLDRGDEDGFHTTRYRRPARMAAARAKGGPVVNIADIRQPRA